METSKDTKYPPHNVRWSELKSTSIYNSSDTLEKAGIMGYAAVLCLFTEREHQNGSAPREMADENRNSL